MDKMQKLKAAIAEANDWLGTGEGVDLLYYWPADEKPDLRKIMAEVIGKDLKQEAEDRDEHLIAVKLAIRESFE